MNVPKLNLDQIAGIVELSKKGEYRPEISRQIGVSVSTVFKYQKQFDLV
jgi:hypothetical protein